MADQELVFVRGLPGSGKTTFAKKTFPEYEHFEADMWHVDKDGNYNFSYNELGRAHEWVQRNTEYWLRQGKNVVVTNTSVTLSSVAIYLNIARRTKSYFNIIEVKGEFGSVHGVPEAVINKMRNSWEYWPFMDNIVFPANWPRVICEACGHYETLYDTEDISTFTCKECGEIYKY